MNRVAQFLRSVLLADLFQVCFLAGLVCFTIAPPLLWWPVTQNAYWSARLAASPEPIALEIAAGYVLASSAGYFLYLWPGKSQVWKIGLLLLLPAVLSTAATLAKIQSIRAGGDSVLYRAPQQFGILSGCVGGLVGRRRNAVCAVVLLLSRAAKGLSDNGWVWIDLLLKRTPSAHVWLWDLRGAG